MLGLVMAMLNLTTIVLFPTLAPRFNCTTTKKAARLPSAAWAGRVAKRLGPPVSWRQGRRGSFRSEGIAGVKIRLARAF